MLIAFFWKWQIGLLMLILVIAFVAIFVVNVNGFLEEFNALASKLTEDVQAAEEDSLYRSPIAVLLYDQEYRVKWVNPSLQQIFGQQNLLGELLANLDEHIHDILDIPTDKRWHLIFFKDRYYRVLHNPEKQAFYLIDFTIEQDVIEKRKYDQLVFGYLYLDDYNEIIESMDDQQAARYESDLISELNNWTKARQIYIKRIDDERFILLFNLKTLKQLEDEKFIHINQIRESSDARNVPISISLGIAYPSSDEYSIDELAKQASLNLDLALGRGGDQVVVRAKDDKARFYGGKTNPSERRTSIRSKLVYQALLNSIEQADQVLISGHKIPDMDSMGAALGIHKIVTQMKKPARVVVNEAEFNNDIMHLVASPIVQKNWAQYFVTHEEAKEFMTDRTLVILVDHHRPSLSEAQDLLEGHDVVIIDHHRRSEEFPSQTVLTYIEPYASSTSELVTEFFSNERNTTNVLNKFEATALLAGIIVDTNNFTLRTGSRTFDAASYLKSRGADTTQIQRMLKEDLSFIKVRNDLIEQTEYLGKGKAVSVAPDDEIYDNIVAAQTADLMLSLTDVEASFVIYRRSDTSVGISARSLGTINVQTTMEKLGGGGHLSNAATQMSDVSVEEAYQALIDVLKEQEEI
ncbi:DHH family phosphoesterase [Dolosicoccus paucivorans]|uniref:DHH family phosphoesterase n=1 Tax=Dolosicoccus paucivorans TaxID=84521 RepID=UPI000B85467F|nr:DHH family phosphoesterase [Dolosicoccus paucivorans]